MAEIVEEVKVYDKESLAEKLGTSLTEIATLKTIDWGWRELVPDQAKAMGDLLEHATSCVNFKCVSFAISVFFASPHPSPQLLSSSHSPPLSLSLLSSRSAFVNEVGPEGGIAFARAMTKMTKLVQADLQQWQITPVGAKAIAASLQTHPRIKSLKMHYCKLGWEGTEYIARACAQHKTLTNLDLGDNGMDEQGARHIAAMLATNTSITRLDLSKNEGLVDNDDVKAWFLGEVEKIMQTRVTPLNLIIENSPGQKWHPNDRPPPPVREDY